MKTSNLGEGSRRSCQVIFTVISFKKKFKKEKEGVGAEMSDCLFNRRSRERERERNSDRWTNIFII